MAENNYIEHFVSSIRSKGKYYFSLDELREEFHLPDTTLLLAVARLKRKGKITQIRKGFYVYIPPEYANWGTLPFNLFLDDLMRRLQKSYYLGLFSAAAYYGAAHQQPMITFVVAKTPAPMSIKNKKQNIQFLSKNEWAENAVTQFKTQVGYLNVSSPELTALDLFAYEHRFGIGRLTTVLEELTESMKPRKLAQIAKEYSNTSAIQRFGYILDCFLSEEKLSESLYKILKNRNFTTIPLTSQMKKQGETNPKWKIIINTVIESDLQ
jgi:predicted transcriptional regulator of viral defense system